ncbi:hypothetical protein AB4305_29190 [Nocardia sp. 2YAB30]|uniref:hypothetical protein n=1 Tax=unclassified Nocardia TaxID=2637762 RepID=UPI003F981567
MGIESVVCAFDEERFRTVVVPALRSGPGHPTVAGAIRRFHAHLRSHHGEEVLGDFEGLAAVMAHVDDSFSACDLGDDFQVVNGTIREHPSKKLDRFDPDSSAWDYEDFVGLMEWIIARETLRACARLYGREAYLSEVLPMYKGRRHVPVTELDTLLTRLAYGSAYLLGLGAMGEGIHGWLDAAATRRLAALIPPKPRGNTSDPDERLRANLWAVLDWAIERRLGLLWGCHLSVLDEEHPEVTVFDDGAHLPVWLNAHTGIHQ